MTLGVAVNPMIVWLWIGGGVIVLGTVLALVPGTRRRRVPAVEAPVESPEPEPEAEPVPA